MKCKICGKECPPGSKICRDCALARKRAFAVTVTEPLLAAAGMPSVAEPRFAPKPARPRLAAVPTTVNSTTARPEAPAALPLHLVPRTLGVHWVLIGLAMAATIVVLLVKVLGGGSNGHATDEVITAASSAAPPVEVSAPAPTVQPDAGSAQSNAATARTAGELSPAKSAPRKSLQRRAPPHPDAATVVAAAPPSAPEPAAVVRTPAPPPRAIETPRDPWQAMNEGLSRCAREDLFSRPGCEERLRQQYCPNYWGLVPQCPIGRTIDHGQ